ncbi:MAG TPA: superoxide dismutase family protein [Clostridiales bacterium]|nr:superoxide dismutase family protein [Eubacteriales bacterium]HBR30812.1 superoxide dismutase family protein [Clostridiales bacterium]
MHMNIANTWRFSRLMEKYRPAAKAVIKGSPDYPEINGIVGFHKTKLGVLVVTEVFGLPFKTGECNGEIFAFHIHEGKSCTGTREDPFSDTRSHYNPHGCEHPLHSGDLPPLFGNEGYAWSSVLTNRFKIDEIIGLTIIIHRNPDDFTSQPSGNSGEKIACGVIK